MNSRIIFYFISLDWQKSRSLVIPSTGEDVKATNLGEKKRRFPTKIESVQARCGGLRQ